MQSTLFDDLENSNKSNNSIVSVKIKTSSQLNKNQKLFNTLTSKISSLKNNLKELSENLPLLQKIYDKEVHPQVVLLGERKIKLAHLLHKKRQPIKFSNHINDALDDLILDLLDDAFYVLEPSEEDKSLYSFYNFQPYDEVVAEQMYNAAEMFSQMFHEHTGIKIDPSELNTEDPEELARKLSDLGKQYEASKDNTKSKPTRGRKKSQKTIDKETREKQKEELKQKSLRSIYLSLAKILHPDTEPDEKLRKEKEEFMKQVTVAYNNKNLAQLLELEIQWVNQFENQLHQTPDNVLELYNDLLKEQIKDLQMELDLSHNNPAFSNISHVSFLKMEQAILRLNMDKKNYIASYTSFDKPIADLEKGNRDKSTIRDCLEHFYQEEDEMPDFQEILMQMDRRGRYH